MRFLVEDTKEGQKAYKTLLLKDPKKLSVLGSDLALKIVKELAKRPSCPMDLARILNVHEQKIYYHIRNLEKLGIIKIERKEERVGAVAKIYRLSFPAISFKIDEENYILDVKTKAAEIEFLKPFIENGRFNSLIIVGSPDPHGRFKAPASDGYCAIDLALFLGQFMENSSLPYYKLDTQVRDEDLKKNIILIGGPKTNMIADKINKNLPIYFDYSEELLEWNIVSSLSKKIYREPQIGFITRIKSPFCEDKEVLVFSGKGFQGTRAAVIAFVKHLRKIMKGNTVQPSVIAKVVQGIDMDSDGIIDEVEFLE